MFGGVFSACWINQRACPVAKFVVGRQSLLAAPRRTVQLSLASE
jgi:hypothetical protein